jgi:hypothetical protein
MRTDWLGECPVFDGLPEKINKSQFLTPRLTREEKRQAIVGPAKLYGGNAALAEIPLATSWANRLFSIQANRSTFGKTCLGTLQTIV